MTGRGVGAMPLKDEFHELRRQFESHVVIEESWQTRIEEALEEHNTCNGKIKSQLQWLRGLIAALVVMTPIVTGLLVYIFQTHGHGG